jgi:hypothetical protein
MRGQTELTPVLVHLPDNNMGTLPPVPAFPPEHISPQSAHGILRIVSFVLVCIRVQITWNGVEALLKR